MKVTKVLIFLTLITAADVISAKMEAKEAAEQSLAAVTVFMDVNILTRKDLAAKNMTKIHQEYASFGYQLVGVSPYTENGDLEGFFLSYKRK